MTESGGLDEASALRGHQRLSGPWAGPEGLRQRRQGLGRLLEDHFASSRQRDDAAEQRRRRSRRILAALDNLIAGSKRGDVLVFTNSSHGTYVADTDGDEPMYDEAMCPYDMKKNLIVDDEPRRRFATIPSGVHLTRDLRLVLLGIGDAPGARAHSRPAARRGSSHRA